MALLTIIISVLILLFTFIYAFRLLSYKSKRYPPGPTPLPIVGSLHLLGEQPHKSLTDLSKIYGPLMILRLGFINTVVISSAAMAKEVLQTQDLAFSSRPILGALQAYGHFKHSVVFLPVANQWRGLRKILNSYIFSTNRLDSNKELRRRKMEELISYCAKNSKSGESVDVGRAAFRTVLNLLSNTIFSRDLTDPFSDSAKEFKELVADILMEAGKPNLVDFFPFLTSVDPQGIRRRITVYIGKVIEQFSGLINERLEKRNLSNVVKDDDVIDALLSTGKQSTDEIERTQIEHLCLDLFVAGTDTSSSTIEWAMSEMLKNPHTMKKAKAELEQVIGKGKIIDESDVPRLPYIECLVKETLRLHPPAPFLIPRKVDQDVEIGGYIVPKDSQVFVNAWAIGRDPDSWKNPLEFRPERFLESEVDMRGRNFELIPFGSGRRICPGMPLATRMVHVMLGSMLNSFDWKIEGGVRPEDLDMEEKFGMTVQKAHPLRAIPIPL